MDMSLNTQHFHGDLSGLLLICPFAMLIESLVSSRNKVYKVSENLSGHACLSQQIYNVEKTLQFIHAFLTTQ